MNMLGKAIKMNVKQMQLSKSLIFHPRTKMMLAIYLTAPIENTGEQWIQPGMRRAKKEGRPDGFLHHH